MKYIAKFLCVCTGPYLLGADAYRHVSTHEEATGLMTEHLDSHTSSANSVTSKDNRSRCTMSSEIDKNSLTSPDTNHTGTYHAHHSYEKAVYTTLMTLADNTTKDHSYYFLVKEWRLIALILDRVFFLLYIIAIVVSLILLFPRPNYN